MAGRGGEGRAGRALGEPRQLQPSGPSVRCSLSLLYKNVYVDAPARVCAYARVTCVFGVWRLSVPSCLLYIKVTRVRKR